MGFSSEITADPSYSCGYNGRFANIGPYLYDNRLWFPVIRRYASGGGILAKIEMWKSSTDKTTWTNITLNGPDAYSSKAPAYPPEQSAGSFFIQTPIISQRVGNTLWVFYHSLSAGSPSGLVGALAAVPFDLATGTFGTPIVSTVIAYRHFHDVGLGPYIRANAPGRNPLHAITRTDGIIVLIHDGLYEINPSSGLQPTWYTKFDPGVPSFTTETVIYDGATKDWVIQSALPTSNNKTAMLLTHTTTNGKLYLALIDSAGNQTGFDLIYDSTSHDATAGAEYSYSRSPYIYFSRASQVFGQFARAGLVFFPSAGTPPGTFRESDGDLPAGTFLAPIFTAVIQVTGGCWNAFRIMRHKVGLIHYFVVLRSKSASSGLWDDYENILDVLSTTGEFDLSQSNYLMDHSGLTVQAVVGGSQASLSSGQDPAVAQVTPLVYMEFELEAHPSCVGAAAGVRNYVDLEEA